jgi:hypothetical protein
MSEENQNNEGSGFELDYPMEGKSEAWFDDQIARGRKDPDFGKPNARGNLIQDRITGLYQNHPRYKEPEGRQATPEPDRPLFDTLREQGITPDAIKAESEEGWMALENEKIERQKSEALSYLRGQWGDQTEERINLGKALIDAYFSDEDFEFMEKTGMGSDPEFITKLSDLADYLNKKYYGGKLTGYPRKQEVSE